MPRIEPVPVGALVADLNTKLTAAMAAAILGAKNARGLPLGVQGFARYVSIGEPEPGDLDAKETSDILSLGAGLWAIQHAHAPGWMPTAAMGATDGMRAASNAQKATLLSGGTIECDLEEVGPAAHVSDILGWGNAWYRAVHAAGYAPYLYVGSNCGLTGAQLYELLAFQGYIQSLSAVPPIPKRGCSGHQLYPTTSLAGIPVDLNTIGRDYLGGGPTWQVAA